MRWLFFLSTTLFLFSVFAGIGQVPIQNPLLAYIFYELEFTIKYFPLFCIGFLVALLLIIQTSSKEQRKTMQRRFLYVSFNMYITILAGMLLAFVILMGVALIELNIFAFVMNSRPQLLGVTTNTATIASILKKSPIAPSIIASDKSSKNEVVAVAQVTVGTSNFYSESLLKAIPDIVIFPVTKSVSSLSLIDNTLIVTGIVTKDIQEISPSLANLFIQKYFPNRPIRFYPKISVFTTKQYEQFRQKDAKTKLSKIDVEIKKMDDQLASISGTIKEDQAQIVSSDEEQKNSFTKRDKEYNTCLSTGTYTGSVFHPTFTKDYCQTILDKWDSTFQAFGKDADKLNKKLLTDQQVQKTYQYYDDFFKAQQKLGAITTGNISSEMGVFEPSDSIKIVVEDSSSHKVADYFETLVHEYLHYASYTPGKRLDSSFFEEGLTEYFARQTIKDNLDIDTNSGYPLAVKIISVMTERIAEIDLADIYFNKDQLKLEHALDLVYGDGFYKNNIVLFESLQYTQDPEQAMKIANDIMKKIGGPRLTPKDVFSSDSNL